MEKLKVFKTLEELRELQEYLQDKEYISFDTETSGLDKSSQVIGFSVSAEVDVGFYCILREWHPKEQTLGDLPTIVGVRVFLETLLSKRIIMQNAIFDCSTVLNNFGVDLMPALHTDTLILGHLLNENRSNGLKERGVELYGEDARKEQAAMKASILERGGEASLKNYELYKADPELIGYYGAKDAVLTLKLFYNDVPLLYEAGLDAFFYDDESMPLLRGPTYDLNTTGLKVDPQALQKLRQELEVEILELHSFIHKEIKEFVKDKYPATGKTNVFNIGAPKQLSWLLFERLDERFLSLGKEGRLLAKWLGMEKVPYSNEGKRAFITLCKEAKGRIWVPEGATTGKTGKKSNAKKVGDYWNYLSCGKETLTEFSRKYAWVAKLLEHRKALKLLNTYVLAIQEQMAYGIIRPQFLQHGTTSGRYSSKRPNFQNLPRDDKRVKACIVARPGKVFVGADHSQLEPRVFASVSGDKRLLECFASGDDFYSVIGMEVFEKYDCTLKKEDKDSFAKKYPELRDISKKIALSATYGTTAPKMAPLIGKSMDEAQEIIDRYFESFPDVVKFMTQSHEIAKTEGQVKNLYGRPRRMPEALKIKEIYGNTQHSDLPYQIRNTLNLAVNHRVQSSGASIMNRAAIAVWKRIRELGWTDVRIVLQVHDELILEGPEELGEDMALVLKYCMENTTALPGVSLIAEPKIAKDLASLK